MPASPDRGPPASPVRRVTFSPDERAPVKSLARLAVPRGAMDMWRKASWRDSIPSLEEAMAFMDLKSEALPSSELPRRARTREIS